LRTDTARITNRYPVGMRYPEPNTPCSHPDHALHAKAKDLLCYSSGHRRSKQSWTPYSAAEPILRLRGTTSEHFAVRMARLRMARRGGEMDVNRERLPQV
jgi:hypothetical protein